MKKPWNRHPLRRTMKVYDMYRLLGDNLLGMTIWAQGGFEIDPGEGVVCTPLPNKTGCFQLILRKQDGYQSLTHWEIVRLLRRGDYKEYQKFYHSMPCPKCGCQIKDPFGWGEVIHDVAKCEGCV